MALEQVAQRNCALLLFGNVQQGRVGWGFEQPDLVEAVPVHDRGSRN